MPVCPSILRRLLITVVLLLTPFASRADQPRSLFPWDAKRLPGIPTPASVLGYELGDRLVTHGDTGRYLDALAAASDRVRLFQYARTFEGRPLRYAVISSVSNLARLAEARSSMQRLANPAGLAAGDAEALIGKTPVFIWLAYSVHGNEHSSTEAALAVAWHLASADDDRTRRILDEAVVFIDPIQNPDGRERFIRNYTEANRTAPATDPSAAEHDEPWPSGRFNHDLFDMNRDWFFQTQPEVRGKVAAFLAWRPQVFVDHHEMGADQTYYFAPPARPVNVNVTDSAMKWFKILGEGNARMFDSLGFEYFTHEVFDLFYPGYGDSWPTLNGATGMTYEEAGPQGLAIERKDGSTLTLRDAIRRHVAASLATVETAAAHRGEMLRDYLKARKDGLEDSASGVRAWIIPSEPDSTGAARLARILAAQGILVYRTDEAFSVRASADPAVPGGTRKFPAGSFIAPVAQPARGLLAALLDRDPKMDDKFLEQVTERRRLRDEPPFYDITSWSLPLAMNIETFAATETPHAASSLVAPEEIAELPGHLQPPPGWGPWPPPLDETIRIQAGATPPASPRATLAYLIPPSGNGSLAAVTSLVRREDLFVQVAGRSFTLAGRAYPPGTAILRVHRNPESLHEAVAEATAKFGAPVETTATGLSEEGIDLGSSSVVRVKLPRIAAAYDDPASPTSIGALLYVASERYGLPITPIRTRTLASLDDLGRYDVIVLPDGNASGYKAAFGKPGVERLRHWIEAGGTLVTFRGASAFVAGKDLSLTSSHLVKKPRSAPLVPRGAAVEDRGKESDKTPIKPKPSQDTGSKNPVDANSEESDADDEEEPDAVPGAILRVLLEPSLPLAFGYSGEVPVLVNSNLIFSLSKDGANAGVFAPGERLRMGGFLWPESASLLAGSPYVLTERVGRGTLVLFADDPDFRGGWDGLNRMLINALLLVPAFEP